MNNHYYYHDQRQQQPPPQQSPSSHYETSHEQILGTSTSTTQFPHTQSEHYSSGKYNLPSSTSSFQHSNNHKNNYNHTKNHTVNSLSALTPNPNEFNLNKVKNFNKNLSKSTKTLNKSKYYSDDEYKFDNDYVDNDDSLTQHYYHYQSRNPNVDRRNKKKSKR